MAEENKPSYLISHSTGKTSTIIVKWPDYDLEASITVKAGPLPNTLSITNEEEIIQAILEGESIKMLLADNIGTTEEQFDELVANGEIVVTSSDTSVIKVDGLTLSVVIDD